MNNTNLDGLNTIITGGARGIGFSIAKYLGDMGANIVIADVNPETGKHAVEELKHSGIKAFFVKTDVSDSESVDNMIKKTHEWFGKINVLVNNAGILDDRGVLDINSTDWLKVLNINLSGAHYCSQAVLPDMIESRFGKIVNIGSMAGQTGGFQAGVSYSSSKAGIFGLTKSYARYSAKYRINVNAVAPGLIATEMTQDWAKPDDVPLGYLGSPLDVAKTVYFLVSPLSDYLTGQIISVNGGLFMC